MFSDRIGTYSLMIIALCLSGMLSCTQKLADRTGTTHVESDCMTVLKVFEKKLISSCPISEGPEEVIQYLEQLPVFFRNEKYSGENGIVRFNAQNAQIYGYPIVDDKSLFLLNYDLDKEGYESWSLFQAIHFFEKKKDKVVLLEKMISVLEVELGLVNNTQNEVLGTPYYRYELPCGSGISVKSTDEGDKHIMDILWVRNSKQ